MRDIAIVGFAQFKGTRCEPLLMEAEMMSGVLDDALAQVGLTRQQIDFYCSGSTDYLSGLPFSFVHVLDAIGPWPPPRESHVEMDGAWALYEAWIKMQDPEINVSLVYAHGKESTPDDIPAVMTQQMDPYYVAPLGPDSIGMAALQAQALIDAGKWSEADFAQVAVDNRKRGQANPNAWLTPDQTVDQILAEPAIATPLRRSMCCPVGDGAVAVILAAGDRARELCDNPIWIRGIDHRIESHSLGTRDLTRSESTRLAAEGAGLHDGPIDIAEIDAPFAHQELILREALELTDSTSINPSGGSLCNHTLIVAGLTRIGEAAQRLMDGDGKRGVAVATSGPCLQQNMVCVLEADK